jgi:hypothetical protein
MKRHLFAVSVAFLAGLTLPASGNERVPPDVTAWDIARQAQQIAGEIKTQRFQIDLLQKEVVRIRGICGARCGTGVKRVGP